MTNCGPGGSGTESCCTTLEVPAGTFYRTYTNHGSGPTGPTDPATVAAFNLDKYLVTVGRFRQFVAKWNNGSGWMPTAGTGKHTYLTGGGLANTAGGYEAGWDATNWNNTTDIDPTTDNLTTNCSANYATWTSSNTGGHENLPINCVTWYEAYAFCIWDGAFLPSEAEWEYAAAGGGGTTGQREYPWGSTAPGTANQYAIYQSYYTGNSLGIAPVGTASLGAGAWSQLDLTGELWEWNLDWYANSYVTPCVNCANLSPGSARVFRGGVFDDIVAYPPVRNSDPPTYRLAGQGFRCARAP
jgi:formylglycine-generating enzyme required for sulfatase activity